jgi:23S rRNA (cytidine1920-2'-O)/16S rRNA (cytidine1409-2'-O)-methyltransferase
MKLPLTRQLVMHGAAKDIGEAGRLIMSGTVYVKGQRAKAGQLIGPEDTISVRGLKDKYVAKGGLKLEGALDEFNLSPEGLVCIDAGASTGGFTDCLIKRGAKLVYAVDAGYGQLMGSLRQNAYVINLERTNIADASLLRLDPRPTFATCDLSYLSLKVGIPHFIAIMHGQGELVCLVKPLFETDDTRARRSGQLDNAAYEPILRNLISFVNGLDHACVTAITNSHISGNAGSKEFFIKITLGNDLTAMISENDLESCIAQAIQVSPYKKTGLVPTVEEA